MDGKISPHQDHSCPQCAHRDRKKFVYFIGITSALAGLLFGMDQGVITGALPFLVKEFHLGPVTKGMVVSFLFIGALLGTAVSTVLARMYGRRASKKVSAVMFILGAIFLALAPSQGLVLVGRIIMGLAIGIACYITPLYLSEISPPRIRGGMIGLYQFMINVGLLVIFLTDTFFAQFAAWRWMFAIVAIPAALMLFLVFRLPRSPRWLFLRDNAERATEILTKLLPKEEAKKTIEQIHATLHKPRFNLRECLSGQNRFLALVLLGAGVMFFQQWTGIDAILYYATDIYRMAGFKTINAQMWCAIAFAAFNCLSTIIFIKFIIDKLGRRKSLFISFAIMAVALFVCGYVIKVKPETEFLRLAGLISTFVYILGFGISLGPVAWIICSEIFPLQVRETGVMLTTMSNWIFNLILMQIFPMIVGYGALWMFGIISLFGIIYVYFLIPETKGVPLEIIEENLRQRKPFAQLGLPIKK